jgi:hypothetical protein
MKEGVTRVKRCRDSPEFKIHLSGQLLYERMILNPPKRREQRWESSDTDARNLKHMLGYLNFQTEIKEFENENQAEKCVTKFIENLKGSCVVVVLANGGNHKIRFRDGSMQDECLLRLIRNNKSTNQRQRLAIFPLRSSHYQSDDESNAGMEQVTSPLLLN